MLSPFFESMEGRVLLSVSALPLGDFKGTFRESHLVDGEHHSYRISLKVRNVSGKVTPWASTSLDEQSSVGARDIKWKRVPADAKHGIFKFRGTIRGERHGVWFGGQDYRLEVYTITLKILKGGIMKGKIASTVGDAGAVQQGTFSVHKIRR